MKKILNHLFEYKTLSKEQAHTLMIQIGEGRYGDAEIAALITVFLMRSITIEELEGFRDALLQLALQPRLQHDALIDIVGTGGDGKNTFNISTLSCFIVAGAGHPVAKHGNYGATSISGSSNVMEQLGYRFTTNESELNEQLQKAGICFLHAPLFHPALKLVAPVRKNLGVRSFFNMLGPMVNPARPAYQLVGVYNLEMARIYNYLLQQAGTRFTILHSLDGYDEISLTGDTKVINNEGEFLFTAEQLGKRMVLPADLYGGHSPEDAAAVFINILKGEGTWAQNAVVLANAAMALHATHLYPNYETCYQMALESLESGRAYLSLKNLLA